MRYQDLKFRTKQTIGFGLILTLLALVIVYSLREMTALQTELDRISANWLPRTIALADLNTNTSNLRINQLQYITASDEEARELVREAMITFIGRITENYDTYEQLKDEAIREELVSVQERALFADFDREWETYQDLSFLLLEYSEGDAAAALTLLNGESQIVFQEVRETVNNLVEVNKADAIGASRRAEQQFQSTRRIIRGVVVFTLALSILIAGILVRVVTEPLGQLVTAVDRVANGDLNVQLKTNNRDEIGQLTQSFNVMTVALQEAQDRIQREAALVAEAAELRAKANEAEAKALKAENDRKSYELEEARRLQLSMLPATLPHVPDLDIAVHMGTATEVGGDYYDFLLHDDGTLTLAIGDATGHGLHAGTMVTATKSLFQAFARELDPVDFLHTSTRALKQMGLRKMFMALTLARIKGDTLILAGAGMPYTLIYRAATGRVEEVVLKGMPLGGFDHFPYQQKEVRLHLDDVILFMSDGISERFNPEKEMFGTQRVKKEMVNTASHSPEDLILALQHAVAAWANGHPQEDDETIVALKYKEVSHA